jgi:EAL domain-containing protein (putative c-di-GMP-specific phosphodiesterase class I)
MDDINKSISVLEELRTFGVQLSLDDFGTGYSSLSYLRQLPVDTLKIDRSFIVNLGSDQNASIVNAIVKLAHALDLYCVAEGVETDGQRAALVDLGCDFGQGYLWSRPLPPPAARDWARSHGPSAATITRAANSLS